MNYLKTSIKDIDIFKGLLYLLGISLVLNTAAELEVFSCFQGKGIVAKIILFLIDKVPSWIWSIVEAGAVIGFLKFLETGLPYRVDSVVKWIHAAIVVEVALCMVISFIEDDSFTFIGGLIGYIIMILLGRSLRKNYQGKIRTLGNFFIWTPLVTVVVLLVLAMFAPEDFGEGVKTSSYTIGNYRYERYEVDIEDVIYAIVYVFIACGMSILPYWYECELLKAGTKIENENTSEDDGSIPSDDISGENDNVNNLTTEGGVEIDDNNGSVPQDIVDLHDDSIHIIATGKIQDDCRNQDDVTVFDASVDSQKGNKLYEQGHKKLFLCIGVGLLLLVGGLFFIFKNDDADLNKYFAKVDIPLITADEAINKKRIEYVVHEILSYKDVEDAGTSYRLIYNSDWILNFVSWASKEANKESGFPVFSQIYDSGRGNGIGALQGDHLVIQTAEEVYNRNNLSGVINFDGCLYGVTEDYVYTLFDVQVKNFAMFNKIVESDRYTSNSTYTDLGLYEKIFKETPETVYESSDGMVIKIKLFKADCPFKEVKAIVSGIIENPTNDFERQYEDEYGEWIYSVMTDGYYFRSEFMGEGERYIGPRIHWSPSELTVEGNAEKDIPEIVLTRKV